MHDGRLTIVTSILQLTNLRDNDVRRIHLKHRFTRTAFLDRQSLIGQDHVPLIEYSVLKITAAFSKDGLVVE